MTAEGQQILDKLRRVAQERQRRAADPLLDARVRAVKAYQHARFEKTYADLLSTPRYANAARFFLDDLYGPYDFSERDDQFARVVPGLVRLFPREIVQTVLSLAELHALSETMDTQMALSLETADIAPALYVRAWQATAQSGGRERQIELMLSVGRALDHYTRHPVLRHSLRLMRGPARAAGLASLQKFLETGFETFREMRGADDFLSTIATRERALAAMLFNTGSDTDACALGQLP